MKKQLLATLLLTLGFNTVAEERQVFGGYVTQGDFSGFNIGYKQSLSVLTNNDFVEGQYLTLSNDEGFVDLSWSELTAYYGQKGQIEGYNYYWKAGLSMNSIELDVFGTAVEDDKVDLAYEAGINQTFSEQLTGTAFIGGNDEFYVGGKVQYKIQQQLSAFVDVKTLTDTRITIGASYNF